MLKMGQFVRSLALYSIPKFFLTAFIPISVKGDGFYIAVVALYVVSLLLCTFLISLAESLNARYRLLEASRFYAFVLVFSSLALILTFFAPGLR
jgi:formate hydrogenlyase subunit 4